MRPKCAEVSAPTVGVAVGNVNVNIAVEIPHTKALVGLRD